jgi:DNA-binding XRE family transcriptional regulator
MKAAKQKKIQEAGWTVGSASDFLNLSDSENAIIGMKLALASKLKKLRKARDMTQLELAKLIGSSQSRVAKMEVADKSVSMELFVKSLVSLGASRMQIGKVIGTRKAVPSGAVSNKGTRRRASSRSSVKVGNAKQRQTA